MKCVCVLWQVATLSQAEYLRSKLVDLVPGLMRGYSHQESTVRKASVFCLVAIHTIVGPQLKEHLTKLSSSQVGTQFLFWDFWLRLLGGEESVIP